MKKVMVIGGAGDMARVAAEKTLALCDDCELVLADIDEKKAESVAESIGPRVTATRVDIYDPDLLREVVKGSDLVMNCTGPYYRTGVPVLEACIDEKVDYTDMGDDEESATELLTLDQRAKDAGITALICCGIAPGLVNVLARALASDMDQVESIDLAWVTGSTPQKEGREQGGAAVIEHMIHCSMGECVTIRDGKRVKIRAYRTGHLLDFSEPLGSYRVFELGHAETATMPHFFPGVKNVRTMGSLHPPYLNGLFRGLAGLVEKGKVDMKQAVEIVMALDSGKDVKGVRVIASLFNGVLSQLVRGEISFKEFREFMRVARGEPAREMLGGLLVAVEGSKEGKRVRRVASESEQQGISGGGMDLDEATGTPFAVFAALLLDGRIADKGVLAPEACVDPEEYLSRLDKVMPGYPDNLKIEESEL